MLSGLHMFLKQLQAGHWTPRQHQLLPHTFQPCLEVVQSWHLFFEHLYATQDDGVEIRCARFLHGLSAPGQRRCTQRNALQPTGRMGWMPQTGCARCTTRSAQQYGVPR